MRELGYDSRIACPSLIASDGLIGNKREIGSFLSVWLYRLLDFVPQMFWIWTIQISITMSIFFS